MFVGALRALGVFAPTLSMLITRPQRSIFEGFETRAKLNQQILCKVKRQF
jgi:hypothetical protein